MTQQLLSRYPSSARRWSSLDPRWGLLIGDILGWGGSLLLVASCFSSQQLVIDHLLPILSCSLVTLVGLLYLLDTYQLKSQLLGWPLAWRTVLVHGLNLGLNALVLWQLLPLLAIAELPQVENWIAVKTLLLGLTLFSAWSVSLRLGAIAWIQRRDRNSSWLMLVDADNLGQIQQTFQRWNPQAQLACLVDVEPGSELASELPPLASVAASDVAAVAPTARVDSFQNLTALLRRSWSSVLVSPSVQLSADQRATLMQLRLQGHSVYNLVDFCERFWRKLPPNLLQADWFTFQTGFRLNQSSVSLLIKRLFDLGLTTLLGLLALPVMGVAAIAIKLTSPGPILYSQLRTGLNGECFRVYKFRSMYQDAEKRGAQWASERDPRITPVGHWLRILRIDELPQIWNVLKGDMSLIGPRPERPEFDQDLAQAIPHYQVRYCVKPGITGWAQVMYPYGASVEDAYEKVSYDFYYIKNYSLWLDLVIVLKTVRVVLFGKGR